MRNLYDILEDTKNNKKPDYEELRYALLVYADLFHMEHRNYRDILLRYKSIPKHIRELKAQNSFDMYKKALNTSPKDYLGWENDPENSEYQRFRKIGNKLINEIISKEQLNSID